MNLEDKLNLIKIFKIYKSTPLIQISKNYKKLLIKHHPDKNPKNIKLANKNTIKLNDGYEYLKNNFTEIKLIIKTNKNQQKTIPKILKLNYNLIVKKLRINLFDYYNYNLNNIHNRKTGYLKYKYYIIIKNINSIKKELYLLQNNSRNLNIKKNIWKMTKFIEMLKIYFDIKVNKNIFHNSYDYNSYRIYIDASRYLDETIFNDLKTTIFQNKNIKKNYSISLAVKGFNNLIEYYSNSEYIKYSKLKLKFIKSYKEIKKHK